MITSNLTRVRRVYDPLNVSVSLVIATPASPPVQAYVGGQFNPDRTLTPLALQPAVTATATDGSWSAELTNENIGQVVWFDGETDISTIKEWEGLYKIAEDGTLTVSRNLQPTERIELRYTAVLHDSRTGQNIPVASLPVTLATSEKAEAQHTLTLTGSTAAYDPWSDPLDIYEWDVAHGLRTAIEADRAAAAASPDSYLRRFDTSLVAGTDIVEPANFTVKLYRISSEGKWSTPLTTETAPDIVALDSSGFTVDLRQLDDDAPTYAVQAYNDDRLVGHAQVTLSRRRRAYSVSIESRATAHYTESVHYNKAVVHALGRVQDNPQRVLDMQWLSDGPAGTHKAQKWQLGPKCEVNLIDAGMGTTDATSYIDVYLDSDYRSKAVVATDENGNALTDENGRKLLI